MQAYGAAIAIVFVAVVLGRAICGACGGEQRWSAAPAVGLASLIVLAGAAIKLPGHAVAAIAVCGLALASALAFLLRRGLTRPRRGDLLVGGVSFLAASVPFVASGRVGVLGASLDNDTAVHLLYAEALRSSRMDKLWGTHNGYPLGPHSIVAALGTATGTPLDVVFVGLLLAVVPLTALVAADVLADEALWRRVVIGVLSSLAYLIAASFGEGAFKETIMAALLLGFVIHMEQVRMRWGAASPVIRWRLILPAGLLAAGAVYNYSYLGVAWFAASMAAWAVAEAVARPKVALGWISRRRLTTAAPWVAASAVLGVVVVLPVAGQALSFFHTVGISPANSGAIATSNLGNLYHALSPYEALGIWWSPDFRLTPANAFHAGELSVVALGVLVFGVVWSVRRRELLMPAAVAASGLIWWLSDHTQSPYVASKALVIGAPLIIALGLRALLVRRERQPSVRALALSVAALFCGAAAYSSYLVLRNEPVQALEAGRELAVFHHTTGDSAVLFLGVDDFAPWQLRDAAVSTLSTPTLTVGPAAARVNKPFDGQALDFDSVDPKALDHLRYVVTTNTSYASEPPANFRLAASAPLYDLWERTGPTLPRQVFEPPGAPGAILNCHSALGRKLHVTRGRASVMATPVALPGVALSPGASATLRLALPRGEWELSAQYVSSFNVDWSAQGRRWTIPAYLGRPGPFFRVGTITGHGVGSPVTVVAKTRRPSLLTGDNLITRVSLIAATRLPNLRRMIPLSDACGQYVDWYRLS